MRYVLPVIHLFVVLLIFNLHAQAKPAADVGQPVDFGEVGFTPFELDETQVDLTLHVDPAAGPGGDGSEAAPMRSVLAAVRLAFDRKREGQSTRVLLAPGRYTDDVRYNQRDNPIRNDAVVVIEAAKPGTAVFDGSEVWPAEQWTDEGQGIYTHEWKHNWGLGINPWKFKNWEGVWKEADYRPISRRREAIFLDGQLMRQVLTREELAPGCYVVDEEADTITLHMPEGLTLAESDVRVAVRPSSMRFGFVSGLVIRGITFKHYANWLHNPHFFLGGVGNAILEELTFLSSNGQAFSINGRRDPQANNIILRNMVSHHNGGSGGGLTYFTNALLDNVDYSHNNIRGDWGKLHGFHPSGIKILQAHHVTVQNSRFAHNKAAGLWLDYNNRFVLVDNVVATDNYMAGIYYEANRGPGIVRNCTLTRNRFGLLITNSDHGQAYNNVIVNNRHAQLKTYMKIDRPINDFRDDSSTPTNFVHWSMHDNVIASNAPTAYLVDYPAYDFMLTSMDMQRNTWFHPKPEISFRLGTTVYDFDQWRLITGTDLTSRFVDPKLEQTDDYRSVRLSDDSPFHQRAGWEPVELQDPGMHWVEHLLAQKLEDQRNTTYEGVDRVSPASWHTVDLSEKVTIPLVGEEAWMNGLPHLPTGQMKVHGVPFEIAAFSEGVPGAVGLRSARRNQAAGVELPHVVTLPLQSKAEAVYVFHGLGYGYRPTEVAWYTLEYADGTSHTIALNSLGKDPRYEHGDILDPAIKAAHIQDWWHTFIHFDHEHAKVAGFTLQEEPLSNLRYLYTLKIENPHPEKTLKQIALRSDPGALPRIAVFAVTVQKSP